MSENTGFRVTVFLNLFFNDRKSRSSVYVNTGLFRTVQAFKEHISHLFDVPHDDFDLHCENNFLPPQEDIRVLKPEDTVLIVPNKWDSKRKHKRSNEILEQENIEHVDGFLYNIEDKPLLNLPKTKLKRSIQAREFKDNQKIADELSNVVPNKSESKKTRKESVNLIEPVDNETCKEITTKRTKIQETTKSDNNSECIGTESPINGSSMIRKINFFEHLTHSTESNSEKAKDSMTRCSLPKCNSYNNSENARSAVAIVEESPLKETPTFVVNRRKRTSTPYVQPIGTLLKELKCVEFNTLDCNKDNAVREESISLTKTRKRYRKRKRIIKTDGIPAMEDTPPQIPYVNHPQTQRTHIKFSDDVVIIPDVPVAFATDRNNGNSTDSAIEVVEVASNGDSMDIISAHAPTVTLASIESSPNMKNITPKAGDLIAFKMLRLTDSYTPELSKYITAKTVFYDLMSKSINLQIIEGGDQMKLPNGKFSLEVLEGIEEKGQLSEQMTINWDRLIEPRLLYP